MKVPLLLVMVAVLLSLPGVLWAQAVHPERRLAKDPLTRKVPLVIEDAPERPSSADCGLYCFVANAKCYGRDVHLSALFSAKYMNGAFGSSVE